MNTDEKSRYAIAPMMLNAIWARLSCDPRRFASSDVKNNQLKALRTFTMGCQNKTRSETRGSLIGELSIASELFVLYSSLSFSISFLGFLDYFLNITSNE